jgi:hypothetical protein
MSREVVEAGLEEVLFGVVGGDGQGGLVRVAGLFGAVE